MPGSTDVTQGAQSEDWVATERLLPRVYDELRRLAATYLAREQYGHTRRPTSLVHEAYLRLIGLDANTLWRDERHFFGAAAIAIRRILVDNARHKRALKRGGDAIRHNLYDEITATLPEPVEDLIALDDALSKLATVHPQAAEIVQLVYFSGLSLRQAAEVLSVSPRSADRLWAYAKAWLRCELGGDDENS
ncbi:ECF-type sigma factor [Blastopirellula sp. J2-11]|uniref:ECF-type sigma factor n=1 Tax=Blastopirellula sp. J2-11 TaxID=2943192 RepID=UPI0021C9EEB4|nr:ECF-type sigma factor [Blastopirellula sp. J2-11]UUO05346.1 ECF-type sigma factor [Blastopirellula sp. J2-11]